MNEFLKMSPTGQLQHQVKKILENDNDAVLEKWDILDEKERNKILVKELTKAEESEEKSPEVKKAWKDKIVWLLFQPRIKRNLPDEIKRELLDAIKVGHVLPPAESL